MNSNKYTDTNGIEKEIASTNETIGKSVPQFLPPLGLAILFLHQLSLLHHNRLFLFQWFGLLVDGRGTNWNGMRECEVNVSLFPRTNKHHR